MGQPGRALRFDVFISYAHSDGEWARILAGRLHGAGFKVFLDVWRLAPGDLVTHSLEEGIRGSRAGILVCSPQAMSSKWVREEYAGLIENAVQQGRRLIPVLYLDAELPTFVANRVWVDFREATGPTYEAKVAELVRGLRGLPPEQPPRRTVGNRPVPAPDRVPGQTGMLRRRNPANAWSSTSSAVALLATFLLVFAVSRDGGPTACPAVAVTLHVKPSVPDTFLGHADVHCPAPRGYQYQLFTRIIWPGQRDPVYYAGNSENQNIPSRRGKYPITLGIDHEVRRCYVVVALVDKVPAGSGSPDEPGARQRLTGDRESGLQLDGQGRQPDEGHASPSPRGILGRSACSRSGPGRHRSSGTADLPRTSYLIPGIGYGEFGICKPGIGSNDTAIGDRCEAPNNAAWPADLPPSQAAFG